MVLIHPSQTEPPLILSLDIGTSSLRALLFDQQSRLVTGSETRRKTPLVASPDGGIEIDPDQLLEQLWVCIDELLAWAGPLAEQIRGVGISTFASNILGTDEKGQAITPLIPYSDTRASQDAVRLKELLDEEVIHQRTGCHFHPSYFPARFLWIQRTQPALLHQVKSWITIGEYLAMQLFGKSAVSFSVASWSGLLDRHRLKWEHELLSVLPISISCLSPLVDIDQPWNGLHPVFADRWPVLKDVPWFPAVGDGASANLGSGCLFSDRMAISVGTSSAVRVVLKGDGPHIPKGLWCYRVDKEHSLLGGALSEGGNIYAWLRQTLRFDDPEDLEKFLAEVPPGSHGLTFLPLLAGERSPGWSGEARGAVSGLSLATTPLDLMHAGLEGVACRIGLVFNLLRPELPAPPQVIASGGAVVHSPVWMQMIADVLGCPVTASPVQEASARGVALLTLHALGALPKLEDALDFGGSVYQPDTERHALYQEILQRQLELYHSIIKN